MLKIQSEGAAPHADTHAKRLVEIADTTAREEDLSQQTNSCNNENSLADIRIIPNNIQSVFP